MSSKGFRTFLGVQRIQALNLALRAESQKEFSGSPFLILSHCLLVILYFVIILSQRGEILSTSNSILILALALVGFLMWRNMDERPQADSLKGFGLVHTAFALGAFPGVVLLFFFREEFSQHWNGNGSGGSSAIALWQQIGLLFLVSVFAGISEEVIFRGMLVSALRRLWNNRSWRDPAAILISALLFGISHGLLWGPIVGGALIGIGAGFAMGYVASGERLCTVIAYHILFDFLSLCLALYLSITV